MNRFGLSLGLLAPVFLCQCYYTAQPMGTGMRSYPPQQSAYQSDVRASNQSLIQQAYEDGIRSGQIDRGSRQSPDYRRYATRYNASTQRAFSDGYQQGYQGTQSPYQQPGRPSTTPYPGGSSTTPPPYPSTPSQPSQPSAQDSTRMYNQGYDYGMRDRAARRPRDPSAHSASMDPWSRQSFEKGYIDAYNALPNGR